MNGVTVVNIDARLAYVPRRHWTTRPLTRIGCAEKEPQGFFDNRRHGAASPGGDDLGLAVEVVVQDQCCLHGTEDTVEMKRIAVFMG